ncbi:cyanate hydratase [Kwoniella shandongensis]|uniref:Cyanate hydratase n=1 Tax=Kwoniella shandongensis TaxID=1734106 RepID=A0A5M6C2B4_9TREE|nr:cyanate hydratase [Kwoniella shandongensis]KAA5528851.1 cyanate hydratase [Kwoniella shandongensis]
MLDLPPHCHALLAAKTASNLTFAEIAKAVHKPEVWTTALFYGQATTDEPTAKALFEFLGGDKFLQSYNDDYSEDGKRGMTATKLVGALSGKGEGNMGVTGMVTRGGTFEMPPKDPVLYRLYEVLVVYGYSYKALIQEKFGDGIMSAINFRTSLERKPDPEGDRVVITLDGKFLPYSSPESW